MNNPVFVWLRCINVCFKPNVPLDDKVDWKSVKEILDYCNEGVEKW